MDVGESFFFAKRSTSERTAPLPISDKGTSPMRGYRCFRRMLRQLWETLGLIGVLRFSHCSIHRIAAVRKVGVVIREGATRFLFTATSSACIAFNALRRVGRSSKPPRNFCTRAASPLSLIEIVLVKPNCPAVSCFNQLPVLVPSAAQSSLSFEPVNGARLFRSLREHMSRMASDEQLATAAGAVERAKDKVRTAVQEEAQSINERNAVEDRLLAARGELAAIMQQEYRIKAELDGESYRDPELGLDVPA